MKLSHLMTYWRRTGGIAAFNMLKVYFGQLIQIVFLSQENTSLLLLVMTLYVAGRLNVDENHTLWFLIFVKSTGGSVAVYVVDS